MKLWQVHHRPPKVEHPVPPDQEGLIEADEPEENMSKKYKIDNVDQKVSSSDIGGLVGRSSMQLGPPRSFINLKRYPINSQVIVRNFHLLGHNGKSSEFASGWVKRVITNITEGSGTTITFKNEICDPYTHSRRIAANCIPLDLPSMCLDGRAKQLINNMPITRLKFLGGKMAFQGLRFKENTVVPAQRLAYTESGTGLNSIERKIQWKMFERERDYPWMYDVTAGVGTQLSAATTRDTEAMTDTSKFDFNGQKAGYGPDAWMKFEPGKSFPQLVQAGIIDNVTETSAVKSLDTGDRLYESLHDHALSRGPLEFPIMG